MAIQRLHLFDFDGTTFRSPEPPPGWPDSASWYDDLRSLKVPAAPGPRWWVMPTVLAARAAVVEASILATGRTKKFRPQVERLLEFAGLAYTEGVHFRPDGMRTIEFKTELVRDVLDRNPQITTVEVWEDMPHNFEAYRKFVLGLGLEFTGHLVGQRESGASRVASRWLQVR